MKKTTAFISEHVVLLIAKVQEQIGKRVLVFGASNVILVEALLDLKCDVTLIDIRETAFEKFKQIRDRISLVLVEEGHEFQSLAKPFDAIIFYDTLHHVPNKDKEQKLRECKFSLNAGGTLVLYEPNLLTRLRGERDQFGDIKQSMYKSTLLKVLGRNGFLSEQIVVNHRRLWYSRFKSWLQQASLDPCFRITLVCKTPKPIEMEQPIETHHLEKSKKALILLETI